MHFKTACMAAAIILATLLVGLPGCQSNGKTHNPVRPLSLNEFDALIQAKTFNGLVAVIASWCPPCRKELPILAKLERRHRDQGIQIVAVSIDADGARAVQPMVDSTAINFPVYWVGPSAVKYYQIIGVPTVLAIRNGSVIEKLPGSHSHRTLKNLVKKLLNTDS